MIPPGDRSIRNIPIPAGHHHIQREDLPEHYQPPEPPKRRRARRRPGRFIVLALVVVLLCGGGVAAASMLNAGAEVSVHPRVEPVSGGATVAAQTNAPVGSLAFTRLSATASATTTVPATGTQRVSRQAHGTVVVTSTYSSSQRLIANTRLEASDGKIYRLSASVDVPAGGSVTVAVSAESPGESYNRSGSTTFTIPGFKGDPRYEKFAAKSQGAIAGGFVGDEPAIAASDLDAAKAELKAQLDNQTGRLLAQAVPATSLAVAGSLDVTYGDVVQAASDDKKTATISQSATASGATVSARDLASALAQKLVSDYKGEAVDFKDRSAVTLTAASSSDPASDEISLQAGGDLTLVWQFDPNALKEAMLGKQKGEFQKIVDSFAPAIKSATATIRPFWIANFPNSPDKIDIQIDTNN
jgi:hypothetical protein